MPFPTLCHVLVFTIALVASLGTPALSTAGVLYGVSFVGGSDDLVKIDPTDATTTTVLSDVGYSIKGLAYNSRDGALYALENAPGNDATPPNELLKIDLASETVSSVLTFDSDVNDFSGLTYDSRRERLFAHQFNSQASIAIDLTTDTYQQLQTAGRNNIQALAYDKIQDRIFAIEDFGVGGGELLTLNADTGSFLTLIDSKLGVPQLNGLAFDSANNQLFGVDSDGDELYTLNPASGITDANAAKIGPVAARGVRSLTFVPSSTAVVPEPGGLSIVVGLGTAGLMVSRRRRRQDRDARLSAP
jgi:DNA-binding beta-propeller fold protein YncE